VTRTERRFRAMGTDCHVVVRVRASGVDARSLADLAERRVRELETLWSRFVPTSDTSRLNAAAGDPVEVDPATVELLRRADAARTATHGWFDPFLGRALVELGYDRTFDDVVGAAPEPATPTPTPTPRRPPIGEPLRSPSPLRLDAALGTATLTGGAAFDPGGIGKGLAADIVTAESLAGAAPGVGMLLNVGGDLRVGGDPPPNGWEVEVDHLVGPLVRVGLTSGALATSSRLRRRWRTSDGRPVHHVVDPRTRQPTAGPAASVTVLAESAWWAEALATATLVDWSDDGPSDELLGMMDG